MCLGVELSVAQLRHCRWLLLRRTYGLNGEGQESRDKLSKMINTVVVIAFSGMLALINLPEGRRNDGRKGFAWAEEA